MILVAATLVTIVALAFTLFVTAKDVPKPIPVSPIQHLEDRKQAIYANLRDLQFEYRVGKLSDEDYRDTKEALQKELAGVLAEMHTAAQHLGVPLESAAQPSPSAAGTVCRHCGAIFAAQLKFCGECGKRVA